MKTRNQNIGQIIEEAIMSYTFSNPLKVDKRRSSVKKAIDLGVKPKDIVTMRIKHFSRRDLKFQDKSGWNLTMKREFLRRVNEAELNLDAQSSRFNSTGIDWTAYHRPSSNGKGWVLIAPDEPANNWYCEDPVLVSLLSKKYKS
uniref:hypothetical protein n=1 Tax=Roseivirga sp. TaxID=1964215 RepID=UPI00404827D5